MKFRNKETGHITDDFEEMKCNYYGGDECGTCPVGILSRKIGPNCYQYVEKSEENLIHAAKLLGYEPIEEHEPVKTNYTDNIISIMNHQHDKGLKKYGETLEDNTTLSIEQRIEHLQEELIDGLQYCEHIKAVLTDSLTVNDYQRMAMRTASGMTGYDSPVADLMCSIFPDVDKKYIHEQVEKNKNFFMLLNGVMGLCGEAGEVIDLMKKHIFQGHALDTEHMREELGDVQWYVADSSSGIGESLETVMRRNIEKLKSRYPDGFDKARSINRNENND